MRRHERNAGRQSAVIVRACALLLVLSACATAAPPTLMQMRALTMAEKTQLAASLSQTLKDPGAAQFKWMPVAITDAPSVGYCGLINGKNSYGGYEGYRMFFATITKNSKGEYDQGTIKYVHGRGGRITLFIDNPDAIVNELTEDACLKAGYPDLSAAS